MIGYTQSLVQSDKPVVLAGDFNVVPTDKDIYNAYWWRADAVMQKETRDAYQRLLAQGWTDSMRHLHPTERIYTFWVHREAYLRNRGFRMDFLLLNDALKPRLAETGVDAEFNAREKPSDHAPVWVALRN